MIIGTKCNLIIIDDLETPPVKLPRKLKKKLKRLNRNKLIRWLEYLKKEEK